MERKVVASGAGESGKQSELESASYTANHEALSQGEIKALFQSHNDELVRYLTGHLKSREEAVEVAQEAYVRLLRLDDASTIGFLRAFLFRTATNIAIDRQRKNTRAQAYADHEAADEASQIFGFTPEREVAAKQSLARVVECIESLPAKCKHAFVEFKLRHRSYDDIAEEMGISTSMVRKYVIRALVHCTDKLGDELDAWTK
jgi:RNA polymerase sigma factor (sigma-70 family)